MSTNPNNTPEQKEAWEKNKSLGSSFIKVIPSTYYHPEPKARSRRDRHRVDVALRKRLKR